MHRHASILAAVILASACGKSASDDSGPSAARSRQVHFSLVDKSVKAPYYNRLAAPSQHLVAGSAAIPQATAAAEVDVAEDEELYIVEGHPLPLAKLAGERARLDRFAVVAVPAASTPHAFIGTHQLYMERVEGSLSGEEELAAEGVEGRPELGTALSQFLDREAADGRLQPSRLAPIELGEITDWVNELSGAVPVTIGRRVLRLGDRRAAQGREDARLYLRREYEELGFMVRDEPYGSGLSQGVNLVATRPARASGGGIVVLSSHLDSVGNAGADDNAAGTVAALATATALAGVDLRHELRIVAFDQEENGLVGSAAYVRQLRERGELERVVANVNVEMPAYDADDDGKLHVIDCNENTSADITRKARAALAGIEPPLVIEPACTNRSDHASFWRAGRPAVVVSQNFFGGDSNPCYHRSCDRVDGMHFGYMQRVTTLIAKTVEALTAAAN
jgi:hypothetical protein